MAESCAACGSVYQWILRRILRELVQGHVEEIYMERMISKKLAYEHLHGFRLNRDDCQEVFRLLAMAFPGVTWSNQGLRVPKEYLGERARPARPPPRATASDSAPCSPSS